MPTIFAVILSTLYLLASVRLASERERLAIFRLSKFIGLKGPGIIFALLMLDKCIKIKIGDKGLMTAPDMAEINGAKILVLPDEPLFVTDPIEVIDFRKTERGIHALVRRQRS